MEVTIYSDTIEVNHHKVLCVYTIGDYYYICTKHRQYRYIIWDNEIIIKDNKVK